MDGSYIKYYIVSNYKKLYKKVVNVENASITLFVQKTRGAIKQRAEIIPKEPDAGNAAEGKARLNVSGCIPRCAAGLNH